MIRTATTAAAALLLAGCAVPAATPEPAPTVTITEQAPAPEPTADLLDEAAMIGMEMAWDDATAEDRESMCWMYQISPDAAWEAFNDGSGGIGRDIFDAFFTEHCA